MLLRTSPALKGKGTLLLSPPYHREVGSQIRIVAVRDLLCSRCTRTGILSCSNRPKSSKQREARNQWARARPHLLERLVGLPNTNRSPNPEFMHAIREHLPCCQATPGIWHRFCRSAETSRDTCLRIYQHPGDSCTAQIGTHVRPHSSFNGWAKWAMQAIATARPIIAA